MAQTERKSLYLWIGLAVIIMTFFGIVIIKKSNTEPQYLTPISSFQDAHGMAVDVEDPSKLYIATHHGLLMTKDDKNLYRVGSGRDDYMGFSTHPTDPSTFFTSGHPTTGGNIGFQKSTDGGRTWQHVSDGINGPVDFHSMAVSQVNPEVVYGTYQGEIQKSLNGGKDWQVIDDSPANIISLTTDTQEADTVYASTTAGMYVSRDQGTTWSTLKGIDGAVMAVAIHPSDNQELLAYVQNQGLQKSIDGGASWTSAGLELADTTPIMYIAFAKTQPSIRYVLLQDLSIYKTTDSGQTWQKMRQGA